MPLGTGPRIRVARPTDTWLADEAAGRDSDSSSGPWPKGHFAWLFGGGLPIELGQSSSVAGSVQREVVNSRNGGFHGLRDALIDGTSPAVATGSHGTPAPPIRWDRGQGAALRDGAAVRLMSGALAQDRSEHCGPRAPNLPLPEQLDLQRLLKGPTSISPVSHTPPKAAPPYALRWPIPSASATIPRSPDRQTPPAVDSPPTLSGTGPSASVPTQPACANRGARPTPGIPGPPANLGILHVPCICPKQFNLNKLMHFCALPIVPFSPEIQ